MHVFYLKVCSPESQSCWTYSSLFLPSAARSDRVSFCFCNTYMTMAATPPPPPNLQPRLSLLSSLLLSVLGSSFFLL